jgi:hypothetical protein
VITEAFTAEAAQWSGWGTALKPAWEPIVLARKPFKGSVAESVLAHGTGALNVDGCRVAGEAWADAGASIGSGVVVNALGGGLNNAGRSGSHQAGRWPANIVHDGSDQVLAAFPDAAGQQGVVTGNEAVFALCERLCDMPARAGAEPSRGAIAARLLASSIAPRPMPTTALGRSTRRSSPST